MIELLLCFYEFFYITFLCIVGFFIVNFKGLLLIFGTVTIDFIIYCLFGKCLLHTFYKFMKKSVKNYKKM